MSALPYQQGIPQEMSNVQPGMQPYQPGMQVGMQVGMQPGMQLGMQVGMQPGIQPLTQPIMQPGVQGQYLPPVMGAQQYVFVENPLAELGNSKFAIIKQQVELLEVMTGCETKNRYHVYISNQYGQVKYLFKCKEESGWCVRNCCDSDSRPFDMKIKHAHSQVDLGDDFETPYANFKRPFKCTCWCLARPNMKGTYTESNVYFGKVVEPCRICDPNFHVYDKDNQIRWRINADCCQCGFCCRNNFCGKLSGVRFNIYDGNNPSLAGNPVGEIHKKATGVQELVTDADTFNVTFPDTATPEEKLMIIGAVLMIDYRYYEDNGNDEQKKQQQGQNH